MTRAVSLQQTVQLVQVAVTTVETRIHELAGPEPAEQPRLREAALHFSREVAFAVAKVYAEAAERRGAWDARLEALIVDALVHGELGEALSSRAAALGWTTDLPVSVLVAPSPDGGSEEVLKTVHRAAHRHQVPILSGVYEDRLVIALASDDPVKAAEQLLGHADTRPVILGPQVPSLALAGRSAAAALSGLRAAPGWPDAPSPVLADELLPERALGGDEWARAELVGRVYRPLQATTLDVLDTLASYLECTTSVEGTARALFVHPNTVRYRLRRVAEITGADPTTPRGAFILRVALTVGRVADVAG
jgi:DNA-binding PucR family transcriptional regulator